MLATNWNVIDSVQMLYLDSPESSFTIRFQNNRYAIVSMPDTDTLALYNYMDQISYLLADQFIDRSEYPRYDSLSGTTPLAILSVQEIGSPQANQVVFFRPLPKEAVLLGMSGQQLVLFDQRRISQVLRRRDSFLAE